MMNFVWVIPWAAIIIFAAGWYIGIKVGTQIEHKRLIESQETRQLETERSKEFYDLKERVWKLENESRGIYRRNMYTTYGDIEKEEN